MLRFRSLSSLAVAAAIVLPSIASAQVYQMKVDDFGSPVVTFNDQLGGGGPAVGPYHLESVNPVLAKFDAICIDLDNEVVGGQTWNARMLSFDDVFNNNANLAAVTRALGGVPSWTRQNLNAAAYLGAQFYVTPTASWDEIHAAIWSMFSQGTPNPTNPADEIARQNAALAAGVTQNNGNFNNWRIIVDDRAWNTEYRGQYAQTFISTVPEPSTYMLMGAGLLAVGVAARRRRRTA